ncbi:MAG: MFS transporter [Alphaproteobacteria bacterium]
MGDDGSTVKQEAKARISSFAPLGDPTFRAIWIATLISNFGGMIQVVGAAWMMTSLTGSPQMVALVTAANSLPPMLFSLFAGALADSFDRRVILICSQTAMFVVSSALALATYLGFITPWVLLACTFMIGCGAAFNNPAWQASVREMAPAGMLPEAVSLNSASFNLARSVGPAVGGFIVAIVGAMGAFAANAVSYIGLIVVLLRWRPNRAPKRSSRCASVSMPLWDRGLRYVAMSPHLRNLTARAGMVSFAGCAILALMPIVARDLIGGGPLTYGLLFGGFGVGAITGSLVVPRLRARFVTDHITQASALVVGLCLVVIGLSRIAPLTVLAHLICGCAWTITWSNFTISAQTSTPGWVLARAVATYYTALFGGQAVGSWVWGLAAEHSGVAFALVSAGIVQGLFVLAARAMPLPRGDLDLTLHGAWREPRGATEIAPNSGPIAVSVEYLINVEDETLFLVLMAERQRIRRRDGARDWSLSQDLENPRLWVERYQTPTWADYVRLQQRVTYADQTTHDRIRALHQGADLLVRRLIEHPPQRNDLSARADIPRDANI